MKFGCSLLMGLSLLAGAVFGGGEVVAVGAERQQRRQAVDRRKCRYNVRPRSRSYSDTERSRLRYSQVELTRRS
jgi:hypothetical protein